MSPERDCRTVDVAIFEIGENQIVRIPQDVFRVFQNMNMLYSCGRRWNSGSWNGPKEFDLLWMTSLVACTLYHSFGAALL